MGAGPLLRCAAAPRTGSLALSALVTHVEAELLEPAVELDLPPASMEAEASVLSAVILDPSALLKVIDFLRPEHMFSEAHRRMYEGCVALHHKGVPIDTTTLFDWLRDQGRLAQVGGGGYISEVLDASPVVTNVRQHAMTVHEKWRVRQLILSCQKIVAVAYRPYGDAQRLCDRAAKAVVDIAKLTVLGRPETNTEALVRIAKRISETSEGMRDGAKEQQGRVRGFPTGLHSYDRLTFGLHSGQKTTITAAPGIGKTAFAMQIAWTVAESGVGVLVFSTEMSRDELLEREICRRAHIPSDHLQSGQITADEWSRYARVSSEIGKLPLIIDDTGYTGSIHIGQICASTRAHLETFPLLAKAPLGLVVVDYIQNLDPAPDVANSKEHEQVKHSTREFSSLLKGLGIPGIEIAQRKPSEIDPKTKLRALPTKGCVADSSWIEKSSHVVVCLQRQPLHSESGVVIGEDERNVSAHLVKHRGGRERALELRFDGAYSQFSDPNAPSPTPARQYIDNDPEEPRI